MMGHQNDYQHKLFINGFNLDKRIRKDHILRKISENIDFDFIYKEVEDTYGINGNTSVPPPVILKIMLLFFLYDIRSERELMEIIPERLDWLWFLGYDLEDEIPNHSVLSKARARWGTRAFKRFFDRIVYQCVEEGLVDGRKGFLDASLIDADASNNSVVDTHKLEKYLNKSYKRMITHESLLQPNCLQPIYLSSYSNFIHSQFFLAKQHRSNYSITITLSMGVLYGSCQNFTEISSRHP